MSEIITKPNGTTYLVDRDDYELLNKYRWQENYNGYAVRVVKIPGTRKNKKVYMHRVINKTPEGLDTDHINRNKRDNRKCNLRTCTDSQNLHNVERGGSSKYKGVYYDNDKSQKRIKRWAARIKYNKVEYRIGRFLNEVEAAVAYNLKAKELYGDFAVLNNIT